MLRLAAVFGNHALFLHSAPLTVRGESTAATVTVRIERAGALLSEAAAPVGVDGRFAVTVMTPAASFEPCTVTVTAGEEALTLSDVLFGELWLAGGQSNMEHENKDQLTYPALRPRLAAASVRAYQPTPIELDAPALDAPDLFGEGAWSSAEDEAFGNASALATMCCLRLSEELGVPCGFLNLNRGATRIETWLPRRAVTEEIEAHQREIGRYPTEDNWNTFGLAGTFLYKNFNQLSACYRHTVAHAAGASVRGVLWYQGCSNCADECAYPGSYAAAMKALRAAYAEEFSFEGAPFPWFMATIYPHVYGKETIAHGRFNQALVDLTREESDSYYLITNNDLPPIWATHSKNHPVHPIHKYELGERFFRAVFASVYRGESRADAAILAEVTREAGALLLRFDRVRDTLSFKGDTVRGLYVAGEDGKYLPAFAEAIAPDTLRVTHPAIPTPCEAAYAMVSNEIYACTLTANGMMVAPFLTAPREAWPHIIIEARPWCDLTRDYDFQYRTPIDSYPRAIYTPLEGSGLCYDTINTLGARSLRIYAEGKAHRFGAAYTPRFGCRLDLMNYRALAVSLFPVRGMTPSLLLSFADGTTETVAGVYEGAAEKYEWGAYRFPLAAVADREVTRLAFVFETAEEEAAGVDIDRLYLVP